MVYVFADCELDTQLYVLRRAGRVMTLRPKVFQVLRYLLDHRDRVVSKHELLEAVWPGQYISEATLADCIRTIRNTVGEREHGQRCVETRHGHGYRFVAQIAPPALEPAVLPDVPTPWPQSSAEAVEIAESRRPPSVAGLPSGSQVASSTPGASPLLGERKLVTVLCCALVTTPAATRTARDLESLYRVMQATYTLVQAEIQRYNGALQRILGNGFTVVFGLPVTQEDHAQRAVLTALRLQHCLHAGQRDTGTPEAACPVRFGLHTGPVAVGALGETPEAAMALVGDTALMALALQELAEPDMVLCSETTARLVQGTVQMEALGLAQPVKHLPGMRVYRVVERLPPRGPVLLREGRSLSPFVGRERELAALQVLWAQAKEGRGQMVSIVGEPGLGKSRLLSELHQRLSEQRLTYLTARCVSYSSQTSYAPVLDLLRHYCGITENDPLTTQAAHLHHRLQEAGLEPDAWAPPLLCLLGVRAGTDVLAGLPPDVLQGRIFTTMVQLCLHASRQQPLLIEIEDLHWLDRTSDEWLATLVERIAGVPILVLVTYRPGYRATWLDKSYTTQITLPRLTLHDSLLVMHTILQAPSVPPTLMHQLLLKADGNPFFLEELAWTIREQDDPQALATVPDTIQAVLAARIDRLPPAAKYLLQVAAVIGTTVSAPLLQAVAALPEGQWDEMLRHLQTAELLYETHVVPEVVYTFKHILTQEVAYQSLLPRARQHYHQQVVQQLLAQRPTLETTAPELLAHHYAAAGRSAQAIDAWQCAAQRAMERSAYAEAMRHLTRGLEALPSLLATPERAQRELGLQTALGLALMTLQGYASPEVVQVYARARALCQQLGNTPHLFPTLAGLVAFHGVRAELQIAQEMGERYHRLAEEGQDPARLLQASFLLGSQLYYRGAFAAAHTHLQKGMALYAHQTLHELDWLAPQDPGVGCYGFGGLALWFLGYPDQARRCIDEALTVARALGQPYNLAFALFFAAWLARLCGEVQTTRARAEALETLAREQGFPLWEIIGQRGRGWALAAQGQVDEGLLQVRHSLQAYQALGAALASSYWAALLAALEGGLGKTAVAHTRLAEALVGVHHTEERFYEAELYRLQGELLRQQALPDLTQANACLQQALTLARRQQARSLELRAAVSLARLWQQQGKYGEARELLAPVYGWFTEGFDTADLQEAKALLETLGD